MNMNIATIMAFLNQNHDLRGPMKFKREFFGLGDIDGVSGDNYKLEFKHRFWGTPGDNMIKKIVGTIEGNQVSYDVNNTLLGDLKEIVPS